MTRGSDEHISPSQCNHLLDECSVSRASPHSASTASEPDSAVLPSSNWVPTSRIFDSHEPHMFVYWVYWDVLYHICTTVQVLFANWKRQLFPKRQICGQGPIRGCKGTCGRHSTARGGSVQVAKKVQSCCSTCAKLLRVNMPFTEVFCCFTQLSCLKHWWLQITWYNEPHWT